MLADRLKLNGDRTEYLQFLPNTVSTRKLTLNQTLHSRSDDITLSLQAKNLGVIFDSDLSLSANITSICKVANHPLYHLSHIKKYLMPEALKRAVHALVSSKLDYCNDLLVSLPKSQIGKLQAILNSVAHLISGIKKFEHLTPTLMDLHWLLIEKQILFEVLYMTYKALNDLASQYISDQLKGYAPSRA